ncbi:flagellar hook-length control protein FliK [Roseovarius pacificus]|uniref:flagellar hook-length control protein FliK n=1 Tax=Roseovarius pacificus TaxID=337701 RepID=UPI0040398BB2
MAPNIELTMPGKRSVLLARDTPVQQGLPGSVPTISDSGKGGQTPTPPPAGALSAAQDELQALSRLALQPESMLVTEFRTVMAEGPHAPRTAAPSSVPDLPRHVAAQLAEAVQRGAGPERAVELTLNPAELGRVRISMAPGDGMIVVTVLAERGETLDLMRRHADILAQEFHDLGYETAEFTFGQGDGGAGQDGDTGQSTPDAPAKAQDLSEPPETPLTPLHVSTEHVDIRL